MSKMNQSQSSGFKELLNSMMTRRWFITAIVLITFLMLTLGIVISIHMNTQVGQEWKELLLLMLGAFIGSYGKMIDYWFSDTDKDKMLVQKMDEEDGVSLSNTADMPSNNTIPTPIIPESFSESLSNSKFDNQITDSVTMPKQKIGVEVDEDGDGVMDGLDFDGDGKIDEYFTHRQCEHIWGDSDGDGDLECLKCGKIKDPNPEDLMEG
jgi:hypothetical protein